MTKQLWAPWRLEYIKQADEQLGCVFCEAAAGADEEKLVVHRGELAFVLLNRFPYASGHLMAAPYRHVGDYEELTAEELAEIMDLTGRAIRAIKQESGPHGFNLGMNLGPIAGAGIADHVHLHLVPRWGGDTNFMPVVGGTRVLPELIQESFEKLAPFFADR